MIKKILKLTLLTCFSLYLHNYVVKNLVFPDLLTAIKVSFLIAAFNLTIKPIIKILLLPINLLTMGSTRLLVDTLGLYISRHIISNFEINSIFVPETYIQNIYIPNIKIDSFFAFLATSASIAVIIYMFNLILYKNK